MPWAADNARKAYELREKVDERERLNIEAFYYWFATGELEKTTQVYELWQQTYPTDYVTYTNLGSISSGLGNWAKALEEDREAMRLDSSHVNRYANLGANYISLNRLEWGALARLGLARSYALAAAEDAAARDKSRAAYQDFLTLWNDADPDIPILKEAKAEYAKLQ